MTSFLERLARRERIPERVVIVVAHPDDEILAAGSRIDLMEDLTIIHITDGSPRDMEDALRNGFVTREDYAAQRRRELVAAMDAVGAAPELQCYWHPDKEAILHGAAIVDQLTRDLAGAAAVITHVYEHGHPDHDTAALCVRLATDRLRTREASVPQVYEFPLYSLEDGKRIFGRFHSDSRAIETVMPMSQEERVRRDAALAAYRSQQGVLGFADNWQERLRPALAYDFRALVPQGAAWYERNGWAMTLATWRAHADALLDREGA